MIHGWRFCDRRWSNPPLNGEGARLYGGRWNTRGTALAYTAGSRALAILEVRVHSNQTTAPKTHVAIEVHIPNALVLTLDEATLPEGWRAYPAPAFLAAFGDAWARRNDSAVLSVPSAVVPEERNYLINPKHEDFHQIRAAPPIPIEYDPRLFA